MTFLQHMGREEELGTVSSLKAHRLARDLKEVLSLWVTKNWRITFRIDQTDIQVIDRRCEDNHEERP